MTSDSADSHPAGAPTPAGDLQTVIFEPMRPEHLPGVLAIERVSFPSAWSADSYLREMRNPNGCYLVARLANQVIGYAGMWVVGEEAHVSTLAVREDLRRRGLGEQLMRRLLGLAACRCATRITLEVRQSNLAAQSLYVKLGFRPVALRPGYYADTGEDGILMERSLTADEQSLSARGVPDRMLPPRRSREEL